MTYREKQDQCGIKEGDRVRVTRIAGNGEQGWPNTWVSPMNESVGHVYQVSSISAVGISLSLSSFLSYPYFVLEKVDSMGKVDFQDRRALRGTIVIKSVYRRIVL